MLRTLFFLLLFVSAHSLYAESLEVQEIILGANEAPPYWSENMEHNGMAGEIIQAISKVQGIPVKIDFKPLTRLIKDDSNNDLGNPDFFIPYQDFADIIPIVLYHTSIYFYEYNHEINKLTTTNHNHEKNKFKSFEELRGKKIGFLKGSMMNTSAFERYGIFFERSYSQTSLFKKLKLGRLDYVLVVDLVAKEVIKNDFSNEMEDFIPIYINGLSSPISIMIAQEQNDANVYANKFKKGLKIIISNGTYEKILKKYYGQQEIPTNWFKDLERFNQLYQIEDDI